MTIEDDIHDQVRPITEVLASTGLPPRPTVTREEMLRYAGQDRSDIATKTAEAIESAAEEMIAAKFHAVETAEEMARVLREDAEHFAEKIRAYAKSSTGRLTDFMLFCHQALGDAQQHSEKFDSQISGATKPASDEGVQR